MQKCVVVNPYFDWEEDRPLCLPLSDSIIYELHVKGFTKRHPEIPEALRGTYAGLAAKPSIQYLKRLGVTAVELMPVHAFLTDKHLAEKGLTNYWGYNTTNFFSPDARYSGSGDRGGQVAEFKAMVKTFHREGIEVILDVVYNHTAEGNHMGPMLSFRGVDNSTYYRLVGDNPRYYMDYTGTGNSLNARHPQVLKLIMDSLRYWIEEMHVDGFRFDLASTLARELHDVDRLSAFFDIIHQDPVISQVKLIAEPWDVGDGGYQVGNFPAGWAEWNGRYRDTVRRYWKSDEGQLSDLGYRLTGSSDLYDRDGRRPSASINFVTAHDGFTLHDLVSYNEKHNEANQEDNKDGTNDNYSWNMGAEGPTDDPEIIQRRERQKRNFLATLLLIARRADDSRRRRNQPHAERQQQRLLPGQRESPGWIGAGRLQDLASGIHAKADPDPPRSSQPAPPKILSGPCDPRHRRKRHRLAAPRRTGDDGRRMGARLGALSGHDAERRNHRRSG